MPLSRASRHGQTHGAESMKDTVNDIRGHLPQRCNGLCVTVGLGDYRKKLSRGHAKTEKAEDLHNRESLWRTFRQYTLKAQGELPETAPLPLDIPLSGIGLSLLLLLRGIFD